MTIKFLCTIETDDTFSKWFYDQFVDFCYLPICAMKGVIKFSFHYFSPSDEKVLLLPTSADYQFSQHGNSNRIQGDVKKVVEAKLRIRANVIIDSVDDDDRYIMLILRRWPCHCFAIGHDHLQKQKQWHLLCFLRIFLYIGTHDRHQIVWRRTERQKVKFWSGHLLMKRDWEILQFPIKNIKTVIHSIKWGWMKWKSLKIKF